MTLTYRVSLANRCTRIVYPARDAHVLEPVAELSHKRLKVAVRAQWDDEHLSRCYHGREG